MNEPDRSSTFVAVLFVILSVLVIFNTAINIGVLTGLFPL